MSFPYEIDEGERLRPEPIDARAGSDLDGHPDAAPAPARDDARSSPAPGAIQFGARTPSRGSACRSWPATGCSASSPSRACEPHAFGEADERLLGDARLEHGRRARERPPVRRDEAPAGRDRRAGRRARDHQRASSRASPRSSTCRRCTTSSATRSRRSSTPRSSTSGSSTGTHGLIHFPYTIERGVRFPDEPIAAHRLPEARHRDARAVLLNRRRHGAGRPSSADLSSLQGEPPKSCSSCR